MFPDDICQNIDILEFINVQKNNFGFHSNRKTQGQKHQLNNLYFKYQVYQMKLRHLNSFLLFRLLFQEPHCILEIGISVTINLGTPTRSVFLSIYIDWGPRGRESDHRRNFPLAHSSFWRSKNHGINIARDQWYPQLWKLTASKQTKMEDRAWRHFKEHKKSFLYPTNFI